MNMPKYEVIIQIEGHDSWEVEADSEEQALEKVLGGEGDQTNHDTVHVPNGNHEVTLIE